MADYSNYYATPGHEITVKFKFKAERGNKFSQELFLFALKNSLQISSPHCLNGIYYVSATEPEIVEIKDTKF